jgi:hypothetical protein
MEKKVESLNKIENPQLDIALSFVQYTNKNVFLTGKAGTGKTTFLQNLKKISPKRMIVVAPTGVAAINAGGVTIHSFFQLPFGPFIPSEDNDRGKENSSGRNYQKFNKEKIKIIRSLDLLVIDEISMVRADLLDGIDQVLRRYKDRNKPFGGVQLLMIGDIAQLSPVIKNDEWNILKEWYDSIYFFSSRALSQTQYVSIELKHIYRQNDDVFIGLLNKIRENIMDESSLNLLNKRYNPTFSQNAPEGYIILTTHNYQAQNINESKLQQLRDKSYNFIATVEGDFPEYSYPTDRSLTLKNNAQVMFIKNDTSKEKLYYNGKIGIIEKIEKDVIYVKCKDDNESIAVSKAEWQNTKYTIDEVTKEIHEDIVGTFTQYPLKLAWAITIHKSQGLTFEKAIIDANSAFAHGQVYVALSRCKTLEGMVLSTKLSLDSIKSDITVQDFSRNVELNPPGIEDLEKSKLDYQRALIFELFDFNQVKNRWGYCLKLFNQNNESLHVSLKETFERILFCINNDLVLVFDKFSSQINQLLELEPNIENNLQLNDRIMKASKYFAEKIETCIIPNLSNTTVLTDNKTIKKALNDAIEKASTDILVKFACFNKCKDGFTVKDYLDTKAKASINDVPSQKESKESKESRVKKEQFQVSNTIKHPKLFLALKQWRTKKAEEKGQQAYIILHQKSLLEIVEKLPITESQLKLINGIGKQKLKTFGSEILDIVQKYCNQASLD